LEIDMKFFNGRLIDHLHIAVRDLEASTRFYSAILKTLGVPVVELKEHHAFTADELWVTDQGEPTGRMHFAFQARDRATVDRFHAAGLAGGGRDNGAPGERNYHPGYYASYLLDPDGNNVEAVHHGPATRSAEVIEITPAG
jgi:catechol 2,3-dioxygenase-like lactoylglutathione lyase family enzyme